MYNNEKCDLLQRGMDGDTKECVVRKECTIEKR
jgi:hypothetical protein